MSETLRSLSAETGQIPPAPPAVLGGAPRGPAGTLSGARWPAGLQATQRGASEEHVSSRLKLERVTRWLARRHRGVGSPRREQWLAGLIPDSVLHQLLIPHPGDRQTMPVPTSCPAPHTLCLNTAKGPCPRPGSAGPRSRDQGLRKGSPRQHNEIPAAPASGEFPAFPPFE